MCPAACELVNRHFLCFSSEPDTTAASPLPSSISSHPPPLPYLSFPFSLSALSLSLSCPFGDYFFLIFVAFRLVIQQVIQVGHMHTLSGSDWGSGLYRGCVAVEQRGAWHTVTASGSRKNQNKMKLMRDVCVFSLGLLSQLSLSLFLSLACLLFRSTAFYVHSAVAAYVMGVTCSFY